ncbi:hypothetical protein F2Q69_00021679 [Brassica cretica]|uniref:Uncharacterized protein n=1 Tax=Brassica cretica TaxID=69181 RepID=A0A8S9QFD9_BRACR|nr:hypothetical protein F2Q69_00021679 [Brassica cretica]
MSDGRCRSREDECLRSTVVSEYRSTGLVSRSTVVRRNRPTNGCCCRSRRSAPLSGLNAPNLQDLWALGSMSVRHNWLVCKLHTAPTVDKKALPSKREEFQFSLMSKTWKSTGTMALPICTSRVLPLGTLSSSIGSSPSSEGVLTVSGGFSEGLGLGLSALSVPHLSLASALGR